MGKVQCNKTKKERKLSMQGVKALRGGNPHDPLWGIPQKFNCFTKLKNIKNKKI